MPTRTTPRRLSLALRQAALSAAARRQARHRELAAAMQMRCAACRAPLARHIGTGNRWIGCEGGAR